MNRLETLGRFFILFRVNRYYMNMAASYLIKKIFAWLAWAQICRYKPIIIGVTGNVGKTSTKEAIAAVLRGNGKTVRVAAGNLNNEFGFALTILGNWDEEYYSYGSSTGLWLRVLFTGFKGLITGRKDFADIFILEYGADRPGDIKQLVKLFVPHIAVITAVGDVPVHIEFFEDAGKLASEKANLIKFLMEIDYAILNSDDKKVWSMRSETKAGVLTYGFRENSTVKISDFKYTINDKGNPTGVEFRVNRDLDSISVNIYGSLGRSQAYAAAAAATVGIASGMNLSQIGEALKKYKGPNGRLKIISGINGSIIIDDTYNASPASTQLALKTLCDLKGLRKIAIIGDMLELGEYAVESHKKLGLITASCANILVCVGQLAKYIAETSKISKDRIFLFNTADGAKFKVRELIRSGDIILVKGSQGIRMEKIIAEIMAEPQHKEKLLVRQSKNWLYK